MTNVNNRQAQSIKEQANIFAFVNTLIRVKEINGKVWFCANDVCKVLGYESPRRAITMHCKSYPVPNLQDNEDCGVKIINVPTNKLVDKFGNEKWQYNDVKFIDEGNIYRLIFKSTLPNARKFEDWICNEVIPSVRRTGSYSINAKEMYGVKPIVFEGQVLYPYTFALLSLGYSKRSGQVAKRKKLYPSGFVKLMNRNFITPKFFELLHSMSQVRQLSMEFSNKALELKGGR
jgi:prophage antirepressor-like protein